MYLNSMKSGNNLIDEKSNKQTFDQVADEFLSFINNKKIIIHNAAFDLGFLDGELNYIKKKNKKRISYRFTRDS